MLANDEQDLFNAMHRYQADRMAARSQRDERRTPMAFVVLAWVSAVAVIFGAILPGLAMAAAVGLGWLMWRYASPRAADSLDTEGPPGIHLREPARKTIQLSRKGEGR